MRHFTLFAALIVLTAAPAPHEGASELETDSAPVPGLRVGDRIEVLHPDGTRTGYTVVGEPCWVDEHYTRLRVLVRGDGPLKPAAPATAEALA